MTEGVDQVLVDVEDLGELGLRSDGGLFPVKIKDHAANEREVSVADKTGPGVDKSVSFRVVVGW